MPGTASDQPPALVDDGQAGVDRRAMLGIDRAVDRRGEDHAAALLQPDEGVAPGRRLGREVRAGDRDQPPAVGEPRQRGGDMAKARHRPCGRSTFAIAENGGFISTTLGVMAAIEVIVDLRGVEARDGEARKEVGEQTSRASRPTRSG